MIQKNVRRRSAYSYGTPFFLLVTLYSFMYLRWQDVFKFIAPLKIPGLLTYGFVAWWLFKADKEVLFKEPLLRLTMAFIALMGFSSFYSVNVSSVFLTRSVFLIVFSCVTPLIFIINDQRKMVTFFKCWIVIHFLVAIFSLKNHGRGNGDFLLDENDLALGVAMGIPYAYFFMFSSAITKRWRYFCGFATLTLSIAIIVTFSRGGLLGLASVIGVMWWFSKHRIRNLLLAVGASIALGTAIVQLAPEGYVSRMDTMSDPNNPTRVERFRSWEIARVMWKDNPIFGVGAGQYKWNTIRYERLTSYWVSDNLTKTLAGREAHSLYFSLLADLGVVGIAIYGLLVIGIFNVLFKVLAIDRNVQNMRQKQSKQIEFSLVDQDVVSLGGVIAKALVGSLIAFFVSGAFISVLYYPHLWLIVGFVVVLKRNVLQNLSANSLITSP